MKRTLIVLITTIALVCFTQEASFTDVYLTCEITGDVTGMPGISMEFYTEPGKVLYSDTVNFSNIDPTSEYNYADNRSENDGKADIGLIVRATENKVWHLKIGMDAGSALVNKLGAYMGQPYNRNVNPGTPTTGTRPFGDIWFNVPAAPATIYICGPEEYVNMPNGTIVTLSFKVSGAGILTGAHTAKVTYTVTNDP